MLKDYELNGADEFVIGNVLNGADSIDRIMMVTYLSQFENPRGKLAKKPIFEPDFRIGCVPYSRELGEVINDIIGRGFLIQFPYEEIYKEKTGEIKGGSLQASTSVNTIWLETNLGALKGNERLYDLYERNLKNLERYSNPDIRKAITKMLDKDKRFKRK